MNEREIFIEARHIAAENERDAYLADACGTDSDLLRRVNELLRADVQAGSFLISDSPQFEFQATGVSPINERSGDTIGPYKLLQQIGEGGMGVVYMAGQTEPVERRVALKIIKPGMDTQQVIARFEAERQALAMMDHPNIAKVLDAGTTDTGRPYFVMELVKGMPVTQYCDEKCLTLPQRLQLFVPICLAVQHAHQKGIIHRDLKPSNILIAQFDDKPVPKVIDFGVAKAVSHNLTEKTMFTQYGQIVGTLEYMSPEQAQFNQLDVDTRSDVYSLGVLLYELLTGETPFDKRRLRSAAFDELLRIIREEEPPRPSTRLSSNETLPNTAIHRGIEPKKLSLLVRGELDWIVMKALEKDRNRRYETANGFAGDILRYLGNEPVSACPPSSVYRLRKFVRRNRAALTVSAVLTMAIIVAVGTMGWAVRDRTARQQEAIIERENRDIKLSGDLKFALERADLLQLKGNRAEALAALERVDLLSREITPAAADQKRIEDVRDRLIAEQKDLVFIARFEDIRLVDQSQFDVTSNHFMTAAAYPQLCEAFKEYGIQIGISPSEQSIAKIRSRPLFAQTQLVTALHECLMQSPRDAVEIQQWITAVLNAADRDSWRVQVRKAWEKQEFERLKQLAAEVDTRLQPPNFLIWLARILRQQSEDQTLDFSRRIVDAYPGDFWANQNLGHHNLRTHHAVEAIQYYTTALALRPENPSVLCSLGICFQTSGDYGTAVAYLQRAIAVAPSYSFGHVVLGRTLSLLDRLDEAVACCRKAIEIDPKNEFAYNTLGLALDHQGKTEEAIDCYRKAIELDPKYSDPLSNLGNAYGDQDRNDEAIACYQKAIEIDPRHVNAHINYANTLKKQEKLDQAILYYRKAIEIDPHNSLAYLNLGLTLRRQGNSDEGILCYRKAIEFKPDYPNAYFALGNALGQLGRIEESIDCFIKAFELKPNDALAQSRLADALIQHKDWGRYTARFRESLRLDPHDDGAKLGLALCLNSQAWQLATDPELQKRNPAHAIELVQEALELAPEEAIIWTTLGVARYRTAAWKESIDALLKGQELRNDQLQNSTCFFLAMAYWQLGEKEEARKRYDQAAGAVIAQSLGAEAQRYFRTEAQELLGIRDHVRLEGHTNQVRTVGFFSDGTRAFSSGYDHTVRVWNLKDGKELARFQDDNGSVNSSALSPDGRYLLSGSADRTIRLWSVASGEEALRCTNPQSVGSVAFSPDGSLALVGTVNTIHLWDLSTGSELKVLEGHREAVRAVAFSPDGRWAYSAGHDATVRQWDITTGKEVKQFVGHNYFVLCLVLTPDGRRLVTGGCDQTVRVWDVETGQPLRAFRGHEDNIEGLALSPDGQRVFSGSADGTIRVWNLSDGRLLHVIGTESVLGLAVSPDGTQVISAHADKFVRLWTLPEIIPPPLEEMSLPQR